jgi:hypothetical protein
MNRTIYHFVDFQLDPSARGGKAQPAAAPAGPFAEPE